MPALSRILISPLLVTALLPATQAFAGGRGRGGNRGGPGTLQLDQGTLDFDTPDFTLKLVKSSQTIAALQPKGAKGYNNAPFDFTPADSLPTRSENGFNHLGDINFRVQQGDTWVDFSSSAARKPVTDAPDYKAPAGYKLLAASDLTASIAGSRVAANPGRGGRGAPLVVNVTEPPLQVTRAWLVDSTNRLGIPLVFNNIITGKQLEPAHNICSFFDPYTGQDGGYSDHHRVEMIADHISWCIPSPAGVTFCGGEGG